jgi:hypothetical protein
LTYRGLDFVHSGIEAQARGRGFLQRKRAIHRLVPNGLGGTCGQTCHERVIAGAALERVVSSQAGEAIVPGEALDEFGSGAAG